MLDAGGVRYHEQNVNNKERSIGEAGGMHRRGQVP